MSLVVLSISHVTFCGRSERATEICTKYMIDRLGRLSATRSCDDCCEYQNTTMDRPNSNEQECICLINEPFTGRYSRDGIDWGG